MAAQSLGPDSPERQLIVLLAAGGGAPSPEAVVAEHGQGRPLPGGLGVGGPAVVRFLIPDLLTYLS